MFTGNSNGRLDELINHAQKHELAENFQKALKQPITEMVHMKAPEKKKYKVVKNYH